MPHQVTYDVVATPIRPTNVGARVMLAAVSDASSGHLRRCSDADAVNMSLSRDNDASIPSWPTMMGH
eukprot:scaffold28696_cov150-Skeletonema_dohrnii-CCMP3373.AAC.1